MTDRRATPKATRKKGAPRGGGVPGALEEHPALAAVGGRVPPEECEHPPGRRDPKSGLMCLACGGPVPPAERGTPAAGKPARTSRRR